MAIDRYNSGSSRRTNEYRSFDDNARRSPSRSSLDRTASRDRRSLSSDRSRGASRDLERRNRVDMSTRGDRPLRGERPSRSDRPLRGERPSRDERATRGDRFSRSERTSRDSRYSRTGRSSKDDRYSRSDRTSRSSRSSSSRNRGSSRTRMSKAEWKRNRRKQLEKQRYIVIGLAALVALLFIILLVKFVGGALSKDKGIVKKANGRQITTSLLDKSPNTRSGQELKDIKGIVVHSTGLPGQNADAMKKYYDNVGKAQTSSESMHFIVDIDGKIIQTIPTNEIAFHAMSRNGDSLGVQFCHVDDGGQMSTETRTAMVNLLAGLCKEYKISPDSIIRHYDVSSRDCPKFYVANDNDWLTLIEDVKAAVK